MTDARRKAWITRRLKYGPHGHGGTYSRASNACARCERLLPLIIRLHNEGTLSEGQVAMATGMHRIEIRRLADEATND